MTRPGQVKLENVTAKSTRIDSFGNKVINKVGEALALLPTTSSTKNAGHMVTITNMRRDVTEEMTVLTEEESKMTNSELHEVELGDSCHQHAVSEDTWPTKWGDNILAYRVG